MDSVAEEKYCHMQRRFSFWRLALSWWPACPVASEFDGALQAVVPLALASRRLEALTSG